MLFDWAAQPFFTVVTTFIFGPYFVSRMASDPAMGQAAWGYGIAAAGFVIAILSPVLGSIADQTGPRKPWIGFFAAIKIVSLACSGSPRRARTCSAVVVFFSLASIAAEFSTVFNDSMMPRLVSKAEIGRISNIAWGLGYLGGMIVLIFVVAFMAGSPETGKTIIGVDPLFGLDPEARRGRARHRAAVGGLVPHLHPADVLLHAGRRQGHAARRRRCARASPNSSRRSARCASAAASSAS